MLLALLLLLLPGNKRPYMRASHTHADVHGRSTSDDDYDAGQTLTGQERRLPRQGRRAGGDAAHYQRRT